MSRIVWVSSAAVGCSLMVYAAAPLYSICLAGALAAGFFSMRQLPGTNTLVQSIIEEGYRGRVMGLYAMSVTGMIPLGNLAAGALAESIGARWTLFASGLLCLLSALAFSRVREQVEQAVRK
jgi:MFS family permease